MATTDMNPTESRAPMRLDRHALDLVSLVFGAIFSGLGLAFLVGDLDVADLSTAVVVATSLAALGAIFLAFAMRRPRR